MSPLNDFDWDDDLITAARHDGQTRVRVYRPDRVAVVLGRGSRPEQEVHVEKAERDGVPLLRRRGGGCSVVLDTGNVVVSCALSLHGLGRTTEAFSTISRWLINALDKTGVPNVRQQGTSDLALGERKVGGACIYRTKDFLYYTTTLLFQPDLALVDRYLKHPPREPDYRAGRSHGAFMGALADSLPFQNISSFVRDIENVLTRTVDRLIFENLSLDGQRNHTSKTHEVMT